MSDLRGRFDGALATLCWGAVALARAVGCRDSTARRWVSGKYALPEALVAWLEDLAAYHRSRPPPVAPAPVHWVRGEVPNSNAEGMSDKSDNGDRI